jgi:type VI secretion system ImpM family protein
MKAMSPSPKTGARGRSLLERCGRLLRPAGNLALVTSFSAYGKLPIYKDFLRHGMAGREAQALRQWLDRGFSHCWEADESCRAHRIAAHGFALGFAGAGGRLAGCLWGSHDQGELRQFPFVLFVVLPRRVGPLAELRALAQLGPAASSLRRQMSEAGGADDFYRLARATTLELAVEGDGELHQALRRELDELTVGAFAASLFGQPGDLAADRKGADLLAFLGRIRARREAAGAAAAAAPFACRLPVSPLLPVLRQAELWSVALGGDGGRTPRNVVVPLPAPEGATVLPGEGADGAVADISLFARELQPEDVLALHPAPPHYDLAEDLRREVPGPCQRSPAGEALARPLSALLEPGALAALGG